MKEKIIKFVKEKAEMMTILGAMGGIGFGFIGIGLLLISSSLLMWGKIYQSTLYANISTILGLITLILLSISFFGAIIMLGKIYYKNW